jgi:hypothetical protein
VPTTLNPCQDAVFKDGGNLSTLSPKRYATEEIYSACFLQDPPQYYQGNQFMVCQTVCRYNLKIMVWPVRLLMVN